MSEIEICTVQITVVQLVHCLRILSQVSLAWAVSCRAHSQPISCVGLHHSRLVTGSADHTVRVFRADTGAAVYTLHGHAGPVTALFLDKHSRVTAGSASQVT